MESITAGSYAVEGSDASVKAFRAGLDTWGLRKGGHPGSLKEHRDASFAEQHEEVESANAAVLRGRSRHGDGGVVDAVKSGETLGGRKSRPC